MNGEGNNKESQEDESPEEMVNRRLAEALNDQQRCVDMFHTSAHMLQVLSRFMADPIVVEDLECVSDDGDSMASVSSVTPSESKTSTASSENASSNEDIMAAASGPGRLTDYCGISVEECYSTMAVKGGFSRRRPRIGHLISSVEVNPRSQLQLQQVGAGTQASSSSPMSRNGSRGAAGKSDKAGQTETPVDPKASSLQSGDDNGSLLDDSAAFLKDLPTRSGIRTPLSTRVSVGCQMRTPESKMAAAMTTTTTTMTDQGRAATEGHGLQQLGARQRVSIGLSAITSINDTMAEISKAAATIRQARDMLSSFTQRSQANNNHEGSTLPQTNTDGARISSRQCRANAEVLGDKAIGIREQGSSVVGDLQTDNVAPPTRSILVRPASNDSTLDSHLTERSGLNVQTESRDQGTGEINDGNTTTNRSCLTLRGLPISSNATSQWCFSQTPIGHQSMFAIPTRVHQQRNLIISSIGGRSEPVGVNANQESTDMSSALGNQPTVSNLDQERFDGNNVHTTGSTCQNTMTKETSSNALEMIQLPRQKMQLFKSPVSITITLESFQDALKAVVKNLEKDGRWLKTQKSDSLATSIAETSNLEFPVLNLPPLTCELVESKQPKETRHSDDRSQEAIKRSTPIEVIKKSTPIEVIKRSTPIEVIKRSTPEEVIKRSTPEEVIKRSTPIEVIKSSTPIEVIIIKQEDCLPEPNLQTDSNRDLNAQENDIELICDQSKTDTFIISSPTTLVQSIRSGDDVTESSGDELDSEICVLKERRRKKLEEAKYGNSFKKSRRTKFREQKIAALAVKTVHDQRSPEKSETLTHSSPKHDQTMTESLLSTELPTHLSAKTLQLGNSSSERSKDEPVGEKSLTKSVNLSELTPSQETSCHREDLTNPRKPRLMKRMGSAIRGWFKRKP